ncbi:MAG: hypothetical protein M5R42_09425 [Rhodocyclaceae bacterium]|nr:hypothetical protein [Rhodocyclaceae bacterium]
MYLSFYDAPLATLAQIERVHPPEYVRGIAECAPQNGIDHLDPDTAMSAGTLQAALRSAGPVLRHTDLVMSGEVENAFLQRAAGRDTMPSAPKQWAFVFSTMSPLPPPMRLKYTGLEHGGG